MERRKRHNTANITVFSGETPLSWAFPKQLALVQSHLSARSVVEKFAISNKKRYGMAGICNCQSYGYFWFVLLSFLRQTCEDPSSACLLSRSLLSSVGSQWSLMYVFSAMLAMVLTDPFCWWTGTLAFSVSQFISQNDCSSTKSDIKIEQLSDYLFQTVNGSALEAVDFVTWWGRNEFKSLTVFMATGSSALHISVKRLVRRCS